MKDICWVPQYYAIFVSLVYNIFYSKLIINFVNTIPVVFSLYIPAAIPRSHKYILHLKITKLKKKKISYTVFWCLFYLAIIKRIRSSTSHKKYEIRLLRKYLLILLSLSFMNFYLIKNSMYASIQKTHLCSYGKLFSLFSLKYWYVSVKWISCTFFKIFPVNMKPTYILFTEGPSIGFTGFP